MRSELDSFGRVAWDALPPHLQDRAVAILKDATGDTPFLKEVNGRWHDAQARDEGSWLPVGWHFGQGMAIRNLLRKGTEAHPGIPDTLLPAARDVHPLGCPEGNWDDYYIRAVEVAAEVP